MAREISFFNKVDEEFVGVIEVAEIPLKDLQKVFQVSSDDPMYGCFPVDSQHIDFLKQFTNAEFDLNKYDYFLDHHAD